MTSNGYGFREVVIDQPFTGKWMDMNMFGSAGHSTFQGTKFSDFGGGFSYKPCSPPKSIVQNRCIYWRTLNDTLELTEISMDHNLYDNQARYIFQNAPIVGPVTIQETETHVIILVATVTSVHRFVFIHPKRMPELPADKTPLGNNKPSIFYQILNKPQMTFKSFGMFDNAINIPVPLSAACFYVQNSLYPPMQSMSQVVVPQACNGDSFFAFCYENGSIQVIKVSKDDTLTTYDLNQSNILVRFFSGFTPSILRGSGTSPDAVIGMSFFTAKVDRVKSVFLVTLGMNGHLRLWMGSNSQATMQWTSLHSEFVYRNLTDGGGATDSSMILKKSSDLDLDELPFFVVYIPNDGFRLYNVAKSIGQSFGGGATGSARPSSQFVLQDARRIDFKERELVDFTVTSEYLHLLVSNPEEEVEWDVKSFNLKEHLNPRFNLAYLEPLPLPDVLIEDDSIDPKEFYMDLVFNKCSFSKSTIVQALTMYKKDEDDKFVDQDWNSLKITAMNIVDRELMYATAQTDFELSGDDYNEMCLRFWQIFYNSCVEYHVHTVKPLGIFYESNTRMICIVKKSRISFLRPTDSLETLYYFPHCVQLSENIDGGDDRSIQLQMMLKYFEILEVIESTMEEQHRSKLDRRLKMSHLRIDTASDDIAALLMEADPRSLFLQQRHFVALLTAKLKGVGELGNQAMRHAIALLLSWERDGTFLDAPGGGDAVEEMDTGGPMVTEYFMGSRLGAHLAYKILKQLLQHRYLIARSTIILQSLCITYFSQNSEQEGIFMHPAWSERREALAATTYYFALLQLAEEYFEYSRPMMRDKGLKVANTLKAFTADHLKNETFMDLHWPMRLLESFCISNLGGLSIRSRVSRSKKSGILAFAEAAGRAILPNDPTTRDHPLEEFLIATCQPSLLMKYARYMTTYFPFAKGTIRKFYLGLANLCLHNFEVALNNFRSISFREACDDIYFCVKYMEFSGVEDPPVEHLQELYAGYFHKVIKLFQIYEQIPAIQMLSEDGLRAAPDDDAATRMCSQAFKSAIKLDDYMSAYKYIMQIPADAEDEVKERKEKLACLRLFVSRIVERGDVETLMNLSMDDMFNKISTVREQIELILLSQANLSDPLQKDGVYQILYFYHINLQNFHKAASVMYSRVTQLGERGRGLEGLVAQKDSLLDVLTCLSLVENQDYRYVIRNTGREPEVREPIKYMDSDGDIQEVPDVINATPLEVRDYKDVRSELILCICLIKIAPVTNPSPVKSTDVESRVQQAVTVLTQQHYYDDALQLATAWKLPVEDIIMTYTAACVNLQQGVLPETGDPFDYIRHIDTSKLPNGNTDVTELAFRMLQNYLSIHVKSYDSGLYKEVTTKLIKESVELPQWLLDEFKRRNVSQLLRCYMTYGKWELATNLILKVIDATLGRRPVEEFDPSIRKISSYDPVEPVLPFTDINILAEELNERGKTDKSLGGLWEALTEKVKLFCERVIECTEERRRLYE